MWIISEPFKIKAFMIFLAHIVMWIVMLGHVGEMWINFKWL